MKALMNEQWPIAEGALHHSPLAISKAAATAQGAQRMTRGKGSAAGAAGPWVSRQLA